MNDILKTAQFLNLDFQFLLGHYYVISLTGWTKGIDHSNLKIKFQTGVLYNNS